MRWMRLGAIGLVIIGGIWIHNVVVGSDHAVCNELRHFQFAVRAGAQDYDQTVQDFEFGQVKDAELQATLHRLTADIEAHRDDDSPPLAVVQDMWSLVGDAVARCAVIGK